MFTPSSPRTVSEIIQSVGQQTKVHFIGIGGIGVSALARWFLAKGAHVSGSDGTQTDLINDLIAEGITFHKGHNASHVSPSANLVVYSNAVPKDNPERARTEELGIPIVSYPEVIGELTRNYTTIAVSGMHGKSTTTAMIASILISAGLDPTVIVGVKLDLLGGKNFRAGKSNYLILEADEYAKAFLHYTPTISIVTNLDSEHLEIYGALSNIKKSFLQYFTQTIDGGALILNADNKNLVSQKKNIEQVAKKKNLRVVWYSGKSKILKMLRSAVQVPGVHNIQNAHAAYCGAAALNISPAKIGAGLKKYKGAWRRMERRGFLKTSLSAGIKNVVVFDDYAHHPTEVAATLQAFRVTYPKAKIVCVFQPHQALRVSLLFKEFIHAFTHANAVILAPIYIVPGRDQVDAKKTSAVLAQKVHVAHPSQYVVYEPELNGLPHAIARAIPVITKKKQQQVVVVMMGAGPIVNVTAALLR